MNNEQINHWLDATPQELEDFNNWREQNETEFAINWAESGAYLEPDADYEYSLQSWYIEATIHQPMVEARAAQMEVPF